MKIIIRHKYLLNVPYRLTVFIFAKLVTEGPNAYIYLLSINVQYNPIRTLQMLTCTHEGTHEGTHMENRNKDARQIKKAAVIRDKK